MKPSGKTTTAPSSRDVTALLLAWAQGDGTALEQLIPRVHGELRRLAHRYMVRERAGQSLQTSALVNEVYLRLVEVKRVRWQDRAHFVAVSAGLMRRILVDFARARRSLKRAGTAQMVPLDEAPPIALERDPDLIALDDALTALAAVDPRRSQVVELRFFGGLSVEEVAEVLHVSPQTVMRDWRLAKAWLRREFGRHPAAAHRSGGRPHSTARRRSSQSI